VELFLRTPREAKALEWIVLGFLLIHLLLLFGVLAALIKTLSPKAPETRRLVTEKKTVNKANTARSMD
jgi:hypothetical protein